MRERSNEEVGLSGGSFVGVRVEGDGALRSWRDRVEHERRAGKSLVRSLLCSAGRSEESGEDGADPVSSNRLLPCFPSN